MCYATSCLVDQFTKWNDVKWGADREAKLSETWLEFERFVSRDQSDVDSADAEGTGSYGKRWYNNLNTDRSYGTSLLIVILPMAWSRCGDP